MNLHSLTPAVGSNKSSKRIARGTGSGRGGTSTRGHKGDKARTGHKQKRHFEGGQMPLQMRLPKRGFKNPNRIEFVPFNLSKLEEIATKLGVDTINAEVLYANRYIKKTESFKVLAYGTLTMKLNVSANSFSESARAAIEALGGTVTIIE